MANEPSKLALGATLWPLITGLAIGYIVGQKTAGGGGHDSGGEVAAKKDDVPAGTKLPAKIYKSESEFPEGWTKSADLTSVSTVSFAGLNDAQKTTVLQALNERDCECGCGMGKIAGCLKKDPNCPRSPNMAKLAIDMVKDGKGLPAILAAIDDKQKPAPGAAKPSGNAEPPAGPKKITPFAHDLRRGQKATKVTIVEFSDFQCPFCKRAEPTVKGVLDKYGKDISLVWMNQPLPFHEHAMDAATAFQAAARQSPDKAWVLHDKMYENNTALARADIEKYAEAAGLNMARFKKDWDDPKIKADVDEDSKTGTAVGANGTPTFFINGQQLVGAQPQASFEAIIDGQIKKADELIKKGTPLKDVYDKLVDDAVKNAPAAPAAAAPSPAAKQDIKIGDAPTIGPSNAKVTLVAFSDFQCPFCSRAVPTLKQVEDTYKGKIRVAFKQMPLPFHDKAHLAAEAALAANEQGKFWEMHDKLFANQQNLDRPALEKYAEELGLNMSKFKAALDSGKFKDRVDREAKEGNAVGATGTPTFFINGHILVGAQPFDAFKTAIDAELK
jgi:protein-disulfide isomerase